MPPTPRSDYEELPSGDLRDHAEERAQTAAQAAERISEEAFEARQMAVVGALEQLAAHSRLRALQFARQLNEQLDRMALPSASHLLFMKRAATVAHMAKRGALSLAAYRGYALAEQLDALLRSITADDPSGVGSFAAGRVRLAFLEALAEQQERAFAASSGHED